MISSTSISSPLLSGVQGAASSSSSKEVTMVKNIAESLLTLAQFYLGMMYKHGEFVSKDLQAAVDLFEKAAEKNHTEAQYELGLALKSGKGVLRNSQEAKDYFELAAAKGHMRAKLNLATLRFFAS